MTAELAAVDHAETRPAGARRDLLGWLLAGWSLALAAVAIESLRWPRFHDLPLMEYVAWNIRRGGTPYQDLFDMNLPGTYATHVVGQALLGTGPLHVRLLDLAVLALALLAMYRLVSPFGRRAAWFSALLLGTTYLVMGGPTQTLQRDWLVAALGLWAVQLALGTDRRLLRLGGAGVLAGYATMIKPQALLVALVVIAVVVLDQRRRVMEGSDPRPGPLRSVLLAVRGSFGCLAVFAAGWLASVAVLVGWVVVSGGGSDFAWMWREYYPLYSRLDSDGIELGSIGSMIASVLHRLGAGLPRLIAIIPLGGGIAALLVWWRTRRARSIAVDRQVVALGLLFAAGAVHLLTSIKLWDYHWFPLLTAGIALSGFLVGEVVSLPSGSGRSRRIGHAALLVTVAVTLMVTALRVVQPWDTAAGIADRRAEIERLVDHIDRVEQPGDEVQVLDTTTGGVEVALETEMPSATEFMYDFHFFHDPDSPAVRELRRRFISQLEANPPRFVIEATRSWSHRTTLKDLDNFEELHDFLGQYEPVVTTPDLVLLERSTN